MKELSSFQTAQIPNQKELKAKLRGWASRRPITPPTTVLSRGTSATQERKMMKLSSSAPDLSLAVEQLSMKPKPQPANTCQHRQRCYKPQTCPLLRQCRHSQLHSWLRCWSPPRGPRQLRARNTGSLEQRAGKSYETSKARKEQIKACSSKPLSQVCCLREVTNAHRTRATAGLG